MKAYLKNTTLLFVFMLLIVFLEVAESAYKKKITATFMQEHPAMVEVGKAVLRGQKDNSSLPWKAFEEQSDELARKHWAADWTFVGIEFLLTLAFGGAFVAINRTPKATIRPTT